MIRSRYVLAVFSLLLMMTPQAWAVGGDVPASFSNLVEKLSPAVVNISTTQKVKGMGAMPGFQFGMPNMPQGPGGEEFDPFREFFDKFGKQFGGQGQGVEQEVFSLGSGFIIDPDGYVVTNNHVIADAEEVSVRLSDDTKLKAKIIGRDSKTDLALLKVEAGKKLPYVSFGNSDNVKVGDWILAIGNPFGLGGTVTAGIISARARHLDSGPFDDFLQTDAAINRGNSGGPMFNLNGEVIGVNSAIFSPTGGNVGIGFAIPAALASPIIKQLREHGRTYRGWLGVKIQDVTDEIADSIGLGKARGALVMEVTKESPAGKAGIEAGDVIVRFNGKEIKEMRELPRIVAETKIGTQVQVEVFRAGAPKSFGVTLGELKEDEEAAAKPEGEKTGTALPDSKELLGMSLVPITPKLREEYSLEANIGGLLVVDVKPLSESAKRGMQVGDIVTRVNDKEVKTVDDMRAGFDTAKKAGRKFALVRVQRGADMQFITLPVQ